jgi:Protein kinase domain/SnoaL-like domain
VPELSIGEQFAGCRIDAVAGRGGMGVVYRATQLNLGRPVALKLITPDRAGDSDFRERFQRESRLAALIDHPNVVPVYEAGEAEGHLYLVMRWVRGTDLHALLKREKRLAPEVAATIVAQVAAGLDAAHAAGLVHRDVKPANVLLSGEHAYLSDFGLSRLEASESRLTDSGQWIGSVDYCSPEQLRGLRTDARADVYALGCVLHAALTGRPPYPRSTVTATLLAHLNDPVPRASEAGSPQGFDRVLARALAKEPAGRYPSAGDLGRAALGASRGEPVTESERSVAVGPAAPEDVPTRVQTNGHDRTEATESLWQRRTPTPVQGVPVDPPPPQKDYRRVRGRRRRLRTLLVAVLGLALAGSAALAVTNLLSDVGVGGAAQNAGALSEDEVRDVANEFADAYGNEDPAALRATLTRNVRRVLPGGVTTGREAVLREYRRQFAAQATKGYELSNLEAGSGRIVRATGDYTVTRDSRPPIHGHLVLVVVRENGDARIGLISATPTA